MVEKTIIWSRRAELEFREILVFFTNRNGNSKYSFKIFNKTQELLVSLSQNDSFGRLSKNKKTRVLVMDEYLIFYEIQEKTIEILSFWDNRQNSKNRIDNQEL